MFVSPNKNADHLRERLLEQASSLEEYDVEAKNNKTPPPVDDADDEGTEGFQLCKRVAVFTFGTLCGMLYSVVKLYLLRSANLSDATSSSRIGFLFLYSVDCLLSSVGFVCVIQHLSSYICGIMRHTSGKLYHVNGCIVSNKRREEQG